MNVVSKVCKVWEFLLDACAGIFLTTEEYLQLSEHDNSSCDKGRAGFQDGLSPLLLVCLMQILRSKSDANESNEAAQEKRSV